MKGRAWDQVCQHLQPLTPAEPMHNDTHLGESVSREQYWQSWKGLIQPWKRDSGKLQASDRSSPAQDAHGDEQEDPVSSPKGKGWGSVSLH